MYNIKKIVHKLEVIPLITDYIIPVGCFQNKKYVIAFTIDDMISKFEVYIDHKLDTFYLTSSIRTEWLQVLY